MADKALTLFEPTTNDIVRISFMYDSGVALGVEVYFMMRASANVTTSTINVFVPAANLAAGVQTQLTNILNEALRLAKNKFATG